jgi:hypothetical protein
VDRSKATDFKVFLGDRPAFTSVGYLDSQLFLILQIWRELGDEGKISDAFQHFKRILIEGMNSA